MFDYFDEVITKMRGSVPAVDVMGFKVVAGGELKGELERARFLAENYWKAWQAHFANKQFEWQKYRDRMEDYWKTQQMWFNKWSTWLNYTASVAGPNAAAYGSQLQYDIARRKLALEAKRLAFEQHQQMKLEKALESAFSSSAGGPAGDGWVGPGAEARAAETSGTQFGYDPSQFMGGGGKESSGEKASNAKGGKK